MVRSMLLVLAVLNYRVRMHAKPSQTLQHFDMVSTYPYGRMCDGDKCVGIGQNDGDKCVVSGRNKKCVEHFLTVRLLSSPPSIFVLLLAEVKE